VIAFQYYPDFSCCIEQNPTEEDPKDSLKKVMPEGKRAIADNGYRGEKTHHIAPPQANDSREVKQFKNRVRARHETFNGRIKVFNILSGTFRVVQHKKQKHKTVFEAVCILCQYDLENGHALFET
jgi:hypothetical protein